MRLGAITALIAPYRRSDGAACRFRLDFPTHCGKRHRSYPIGGIAPQRPRDHVRLPRDHAQIGQGRCIGLLPVLLPVPQGADRHMVARGEFGLRDA